jgi:hypothetical protein
MKEFKSLKALKDFLDKSVKSALSDEPPKAVKNLMRKHILRDVYMVYKPEKYVRRYNDNGLWDIRNIKVDHTGSNTLEIYNDTKRNIRFRDEYLTPLIEFGHLKAKAKGYRGYTFPNPKKEYYNARPFTENTRKSLAKNKSHVKAFQQSLKKLGIKTE